MDKLAPLKIVSLFMAGYGVLFHPMGYAFHNSTPPNQTTQTMAVHDEAIKSKLQSSLRPYVNKITVMVTNGVVNISGQLDSNTDYERVVTITESMDGVMDVNVDNLTVKDSHSPLTDIYLTAKVKGALIKSDIMGKDISVWSVHVETRNGQVYLSGSVTSEEEKEHILAIVNSVKGISKVINEMTVSNHADDE